MSKSGSRTILTKENLEQYRLLVEDRVKQWKTDGTHDEQDIQEGNTLMMSMENISHRFDECAVLRKPLPEEDQEVLRGMGFTKVGDVPKWSNDMMKSLEKHGSSLVQCDEQNSPSEDKGGKLYEKVDDQLPFEDDVLDLPTLGDEKYESMGGGDSISFDLNEYLKEQENEVNEITSGLDRYRKEQEKSNQKISPPKETKTNVLKKSPPPERMIQKALFDDFELRKEKKVEILDDDESSEITTTSDEDNESKRSEYPMNIPNFAGVPPEDMMMIMGYDDEDNEYLPKITKSSSSSSSTTSEILPNEKNLSPIEPPKSHQAKSSPPRTVRNQSKRVDNVAVTNEFVPPGLLSRQKKLEKRKRYEQQEQQQQNNFEEEEEEDVIDDDQNDRRDFDHILNLSQLEKETENYENQLLNKIHDLNPLKKEEEAREVTPNRSSKMNLSRSSKYSTSSSTTNNNTSTKRIPSTSQFPLPTPPQFPRLPNQSLDMMMPKLPLFPHPPPSLGKVVTETTTTPSLQKQTVMGRKAPPSTVGSTISSTSTLDGTRNESLMMEEFEKIRTHELGQFRQFLRDVQGEFKEVFRNKLSKEEFYGMYKELKTEIEKIKSEKDDKLDREFQHLKQMIRKHIPEEEERKKASLKVQKKKKEMMMMRSGRGKRTESPEKRNKNKSKFRNMEYSDDEEQEKKQKKRITTIKRREQQQQQQIQTETETETEEEELDFELRRREVRKMKKDEEERMQYHLMLNQTIKEENQMLRKFVRQIKSEMSNRKNVLETEMERLKRLVGECSLKDFSSMPIKQQEFEKLGEYEMKLVQLETTSGEQSTHQMYYPDDINDPIDHELSRLLNEIPVTGGVRIEMEKMEQYKYLADQILHLKMIGGMGRTGPSRNHRDGLLVVTNMNNMPLEDYLMELYAPFISEEKRRVFMKKNNGGVRNIIKGRGGGGGERAGIVSTDSDDEEVNKLLRSSGHNNNNNPLSNLSNLPLGYEIETMMMEGVHPTVGASSQQQQYDDIMGRNQILEKMKFEREYKSPALIDDDGLLSAMTRSQQFQQNRGGKKRKGGRRGGTKRKNTRGGRGRGGRKRRGGGRRAQQEEIVGRGRQGKKTKKLYDY